MPEIKGRTPVFKPVRYWFYYQGLFCGGQTCRLQDVLKHRRHSAFFEVSPNAVSWTRDPDQVEGRA